MSSTLIDGTTDNVYICMYRIGLLIFTLGSERIELNHSNILSIEKIDNYDYNLRSILKLRLRLDIRQKIWIIKNKANIICKFELDKFGMDVDIESEVTGEQYAWNNEFAVYLTDDDASIDTDTLEDVMESNGNDTFNAKDIHDNDYLQGQDIFDVFLYDAKLITASKKLVNKVYTSGTVQTFAAQILTESGHKKVLMSPFENSNSYSEMCLPENEAYKALVYLDQYYGFYRRGASIFYDVDALYIINPNGMITAKRPNEWIETDFLVTARNNSTPGNGMVYKPNQKMFYINVPEENVSPKKPKEAKDVEYGSSVKLVTTDEISVSTSAGTGTGTYHGYQRSSDNPFSAEIVRARMEENDSIMFITGNGFDLNAFSLNKVYKMIFEDQTKQKKYGNNRYRIAYAYHYLVLQSDQYLRSSHQIVLKKCL